MQTSSISVASSEATEIGGVCTQAIFNTDLNFEQKSFPTTTTIAPYADVPLACHALLPNKRLASQKRLRRKLQQQHRNSKHTCFLAYISAKNFNDGCRTFKGNIFMNLIKMFKGLNIWKLGATFDVCEQNPIEQYFPVVRLIALNAWPCIQMESC